MRRQHLTKLLAPEGIFDSIRSRFQFKLITTCLLLLVGADIHAQSGPSIIRGQVMDPNGAIISGARVILINSSGRTRAVKTDEEGAFTFNDVRPDRYSLKVEAQGFSPYEIQDLDLASAGREVLKIALSVAEISASMEIKSESQRLSLEGGRNLNAIVLRGPLLRLLPRDQANLLRVLRQLAGPAATAGIAGGAQVLVNGLSGGPLPPLSAIREIRINSDPYSAQYQEPGTARIEIETKSGGQQFQASAFLLYGNSSLDARNAFSQSKPPYSQRHLGGWLSGPLRKDRASFFSYFEHQQDSSATSVVAVVPSDLYGRPRPPLEQITEDLLMPSRNTSFSIGADAGLSANHRLTLQYSFVDGNLRNQGIGGLDLSERGFNSAWREHGIQFSETAILSANAVNELSLQLLKNRTSSIAFSDDVTQSVVGAFSIGGAGCCPDDRLAEGLMVRDNLSIVRSRHQIIAGAQLEATGLSITSFSGFNGAFTFPTLASFINRRPSLFSINFGDPFVGFALFKVSYFAQDSVSLRPDLTLSFGLRHELQNHLRDRNNFAPRLSLAWAPGGDQDTVVRAGFGVFYGSLGEELIEAGSRFLGLRQREIVVIRPRFPDPFIRGDMLERPPSVIRIARQARAPYSLHTNIGIERQLPRGLALSGNYTFSRSLHLFRLHNRNAPLPETGERPDDSFMNINQYESSSSSVYHGLTVGVSQNLSERFSLIASYTLSRTMNDADSPSALPADNYNLRAEWGPAATDQRHQFFAGATLSLPLDLQTGVFVNIASALPYNITTGLDDNLDTAFNDRPAGVKRNSSRGAPYASVDMRLSKMFYTDLPRRRRAANNGSPSQGNSTGAGSEKPFAVELSVEAGNLFNKTNPADFIGVLSSPLFGRANSAHDGRRIQFQVSFNFR